MNTEARSVRVVVHPDARRERINETKPGYFEIHVREEAREGSANDRVRILIALHLNVPVAGVVIVRGHKSRSKILRIQA